MKRNLQNNWWVLTINGILAILFGALTLFDSQSVMISLSMYFGLLFLIGGALLIFGALDLRRKQKHFGIMLFEGIIISTVGILIMIYPLQTLKIFLLLIGVWAFLGGLLKVYVAISLGKTLAYRQLLVFTGVLLSAIGLLLLIDPTWTAVHVLKIIGIIFIAIGLMTIYFSIAVRNAQKEG